MATIDKNFKVKNGLVVEGSTATVNGDQVLTENASDQYIINLIGGTATPDNTPDAVVKRDENGDFAAGEITADLVGDVTGQVSDISNHDTDDLAEGTTNKYFTDSRVKDVLTGATKTNITIETIAGELHITAENGVADSTTDDLTEGASNKYFTDSRVQDVLSNSAGMGLDWNSNTNSFDINASGAVGDSSVSGLTVYPGTGPNAVSFVAIDRNTVDTWYDAEGAAQDVQDNLDTHTNATSAHGVTGNIVGTSDTQTLTNKTLEGTIYLGVDNTNAAYIQTETDSAGNLTVHAGNDLTLSTNSGDIVINPDGTAYIGSASAGNEIATNSYVDNAVAGLNWKQAVNLLWDDTQITMSGSTGTLALDAHPALTQAENGYRILTINMGADNGIWVYSDNGTNWSISRPADADTYQELIGAAVYVMEGTQYGSTSWVQGDHYLTDFTGQDWTQFSGNGSVTAGTGIIVDGLQVSVDTDVIATQFYADSAVGTHSDYTSNIHGVTGDVVGTSDAQDLSNKTFKGQTNFQSAGGAGGTNNHIDVDNSTGKMTVESGYALDLTSQNDVTITSWSSDVVLKPDGNAFLWNKNAENQIATQGYVDGQTTDDISEGTAQYFTQARARESLSAGNAINYNSTTGEIAVDASQLDTDDISEGATNHYFTDGRAKDAAADLLTNATLSNITITGTGTGLTITAENGVADSDTDDLTEGSTNLYFTDARARTAVDGTTRSFTAININDYRKEEATQQYVASASTVTAHTFTGNRSVKYLIRTVGDVSGTLHSQITELLATVDGASNVAVTEYGTIHSSENPLSSATVDFAGGEFRLRVTTAIAGAEVVAAATIMSWAD